MILAKKPSSEQELLCASEIMVSAFAIFVPAEEPYVQDVAAFVAVVVFVAVVILIVVV